MLRFVNSSPEGAGGGPADASQDPKVDPIFKVTAEGKEHSFNLSKPEDRKRVEEAIQFGIPGKRIYADRDKASARAAEMERTNAQLLAQIEADRQARENYIPNRQEEEEIPEQGTQEYTEYYLAKLAQEVKSVKDEIQSRDKAGKAKTEQEAKLDRLITHVEETADWDPKTGKSIRYPNLTGEDLHLATFAVYGGAGAEEALEHFAGLREKAGSGDDEVRVRAAADAARATPSGGGGPGISSVKVKQFDPKSLKGKTFREAMETMTEAQADYRRSFAEAAKG